MKDSKGWTIRKVLGWGGEGWGKSKKKIMQRGVNEKRKRAKKKWKKNPAKRIAPSGLHVHSPRLKGALAATLYCSFNFLVLVESPFTLCSLQLGKREFFPIKADTFCTHQLHHGH